MHTFLKYLRDMIQLVMSPTHGWEDISYDDFDVKRLVTAGFVPWIAIVAFSAIVGHVLSSNINVLMIVSHMLVIFIKYFVTYFVAGFAFSIYMPVVSKGRSKETLNSIFIAFSLGLLAIMDLLKDCLPIDLAILNFMPLYILLVMWRGGRYIKYTEGHALGFVTLCFGAVVMPPFLLQLAFELILP